MRALIVPNLLDTIETVLPDQGHRSDPTFLALCERIQGRVVTLTFTGLDAFEAEDDNWWLPNACWTEVKARP